jgi:hypothetical protein
LSDCPKKVIFHLTALNDKFRECQKEELNRTQVLEKFSIYAQLDEIAPLEGNANRKKDFTFSFCNDSGIDEDVCCEPHLKLCYSDTDKSYSNDRRIYFHEGKTNIQNGTILVGPTIYALVRNRLLPCYKNGKKLYFFEDELLDWISKGKKKTFCKSMPRWKPITNILKA